MKEIIMMKTHLPEDGRQSPRARRSLHVALLAALACVLVAAWGAGNARADFGVASFDGAITNADGSQATQAGSHPYALTTSIQFNITTDSSGNPKPDGNVKDIAVDLPPGLVGAANAVPQCQPGDFYDVDKGCPNSTAVGRLDLALAFGFSVSLPVYNLVPPPGMPAQFGASLFQFGPVIPIVVNTGVRSSSDIQAAGSYAITASARNISQGEPISGTTLTLWGVPADPSHDTARGSCLGLFGDSSGSCPAGGAGVKPLLTLPTACSGPLTFSARADSWQDPATTIAATFVTHDSSNAPVGVDGCNKLDFTPSIRTQPITTGADSPSGLSVDLKVPQNENPAGLAEANLRDAVVALPQGMSVNPSAANGLTACSPAQIALTSSSEPNCPDASKIGTVEVTTPLIDDPLRGAVYVAQQNANPFGSLLAVYLTAEADGVVVKLAGKIDADQQTGQLTTTFANNPQLPFSDFKLRFFGGPHAALATPLACGTQTTTTQLTPWNGLAASTPSDSFSIDSGCATGFSPSFTAGTAHSLAGAFSPVTLSFSRSDSDQELSALTVSLPPGLLAKTAGVPLCSDADASGGTCPAGSQVGTVQVGAGAGSDPLFLPGKAYLTGPYKGGPYGLAVVVPAVAGPYDLGTVIVRQAIHIDPTDAHVSVTSDPFPQILRGIPLRLRRVDVTLDRPGFTLNPTSCAPMQITGTLTSVGGASAPVSSRFQVGGCSGLGFSPKLALKLTGKGQTVDGKHPALHATLTQPAAQANIKSERVALPLSMALDPDNSQHVCSVADAAKDACPVKTKVGTASAVTPLLDHPLKGDVFLVQGIRTDAHGVQHKTLPTLLVPLRGQIALDLRAKTSVSHGKLVTTFPAIPDAAVRKFSLTIAGGRRGILVVTHHQHLCAHAQLATVLQTAHNGKQSAPHVKIGTPCTRRK
jgi:hypothetical protein